MRLLVIVAMCAVVLRTGGAAFAKYAALPLSELVAQSDVIARVRILSTRRNPQVPERITDEYWRTHGRLNLARSLAKARVIEPFKGVKKGAELEIGFDNGAGCPNVWYKQGEDCVVFLASHKGGDVYGTLNYGNGRKLILRSADYREWAARIKEQLKKNTTAAERPN